MLEQIFSLFSKEPSADEKALTIADILNKFFAIILGFMGIESETEAE